MDYITLAVPFFFLFIAVEAIWARIERKRYYRLNDSLNDLGCGIIQQVIGVFLRGAIAAGYIWIYERHALLPISPGTTLAWLSLFVGVDFCYYWFHRASHEVNALWAVHVVHHQSEEYNLSVALRQATFQSAISWVFYLPLALVGFPPVMFFTMSALNTLYQFWIHTRFIGKLGPLEWVINTPSHHRVHHGSNPKYIDRNHGGTLIIWDRLFGTFQEEEEEPIYGVTRPLQSWNPVWANLHAWVDLWRQARRFPRLRDRLLVWFMPPGWHPPGVVVPPAPRGDKYDTQAPIGLKGYIVSHFIPATLGAVALLVFSSKLPAPALYALAAAVILTLTCLGGLFEHKRWSLPLELFRLALCVAMAVLALRGHPQRTAGVVLCLALAAGSVLWLKRYRAFLSGAPA